MSPGRKEVPFRSPSGSRLSLETRLARGLLFRWSMELETAFAWELSRLLRLADTASRETVSRRSWWIEAVRDLARMVF
jgi:hypothetical protein